MALDDKLLALLLKNRKLLIKLLAETPKNVRVLSEAEKKQYEAQLKEQRQQHLAQGRFKTRHPSSFTAEEWRQQQERVAQLKADRKMNYKLDCWHPPPKEKGKKPKKQVTDAELLEAMVKSPVGREMILKILERGDV